MQHLKPSEIVKELDKYIIGQGRAKRSVAVALRNRWRRQQVPEELRDEIAPKNIILIGPTGVGKTEIARRLAIMTDSPFFKVEASKFTEVGYVGRDVESMIRDLVELTVNNCKINEQEAVKERAMQIAEERMLDLLLPKSGAQQQPPAEDPKTEAMWKRYAAGDRTDAVTAAVQDRKKRKMKLVLEAEDAELFRVEEVALKMPAPAKIHQSMSCSRCGEKVMEPRLRQAGGEKLCIPCSEKAGSAG